MSSSAHLPDGELRALVDGELPAPRALELRQHTAHCAACAARLREIEQDAIGTGQLLDLLGQPASPVRLERVLRQARRARTWRAALIAASVTLAVVSVAGATAGRPLVRALAGRIRALFHPATPVTPPTTAPNDSMGIAFVPGIETVIAFDSGQGAGLLRISLADTAELVIRSDAAVSYRVHAGGVVVHNPQSAASYDLIIPRALPHVRVLVGGRLVLEKIGPRIVTGTVADTAPSVILPVR